MVGLASATLTEPERLALDQFVSALVRSLGEDLEAVWLYGSRARREEPRPESDIDVIVLTRKGEPDRSRVWRIALETGDAGLKIAPITTRRAWIIERRAIESFFIQEVDRDKIVLFGEP
ncbi:MAG: nucleotidyltransferase domain-containing protein [Actinomycetota bacterium]|nr:nucleotidyltransferase domain-containing protein [Actinomycetota bacterium]